MRIRKPRILIPSSNLSSNHLLVQMLVVQLWRRQFLPRIVKTRKVFLNNQICLKVRRSLRAQKLPKWYAFQLKRWTQHISHKLAPSTSMTNRCQQVRINLNLNFKTRPQLKNLLIMELGVMRMEMCSLLKMMKLLAHKPISSRLSNWKLKISTTPIIKELTQLPPLPLLATLHIVSKNSVVNISKTRILLKILNHRSNILGHQVAEANSNRCQVVTNPHRNSSNTLLTSSRRTQSIILWCWTLALWLRTSKVRRPKSQFTPPTLSPTNPQIKLSLPTSSDRNLFNRISNNSWLVIWANLFKSLSSRRMASNHKGPRAVINKWCQGGRLINKTPCAIINSHSLRLLRVVLSNRLGDTHLRRSLILWELVLERRNPINPKTHSESHPAFLISSKSLLGSPTQCRKWWWTQICTTKGSRT